MDSIHSWIDQDELNKLAEGLMGEVSIREWEKSEYDGFAIPEQTSDKIVEEPEASEVPEEVQEALAKASEAATEAGMVKPKTEPVAQLSSPVTPASETTGPTETVQAETQPEPTVAEAVVGTFVEMDQKMQKAISAQGICVTDRDGDVLYDSMNSEQLARFVVTTLKGSPLLKVGENQLGNMRLKISADTYMEFTSVMSTRGVLVASALVNKPLHSETVKHIAAEMQRIANAA